MVAQVFKPAIGDLDLTAQASLGTIYELDNKRYKYVKFSGTTAITANDFCCYVVSDELNQTVDQANSVLGAGCAMASLSTGTVYYGWIQISGLVTLNVALDAGSDGDALTNNGATAGTLRAIDAHAEPQVAIAIDASDKQVCLMCPN